MGFGAGIATRRRRPWAGVLAASILVGTLLGTLLGIVPAEAARLIAIKGAQAERYGRITLTFDTQVSVKASISGSVLVLRYGERSPSSSERITAEMPDYVSMVRRDPDSTGMRIALQRPYRLNVQTAAEHVFIDLLPDDWVGLPPPLPPEIVADLVRRTRVAEAAARAMTPVVEPRRLVLEVSQLPTLTRLSLRAPPEAISRFETVGTTTQLLISGAWRIDDVAARGRVKPAIEMLVSEADAQGARLLVTPGADHEVRTARDEDGITIDVALKKAPTVDKPVTVSAAAVAGPMKAPPAAPAPARDPPEAKPVSMPAAVVRPAGPGLVFPFRRQPPAALFERSGIATLVFETPESVTRPAGDGTFAPLGEPVRTGGFVALRFTAPRDRLLDLIPTGNPEAPRDGNSSPVRTWPPARACRQSGGSSRAAVSASASTCRVPAARCGSTSTASASPW